MGLSLILKLKPISGTIIMPRPVIRQFIVLKDKSAIAVWTYSYVDSWWHIIIINQQTSQAPSETYIFASKWLTEIIITDQSTENKTGLVGCSTLKRPRIADCLSPKLRYYYKMGVEKYKKQRWLITTKKEFLLDITEQFLIWAYINCDSMYNTRAIPKQTKSHNGRASWTWSYIPVREAIGKCKLLRKRKSFFLGVAPGN